MAVWEAATIDGLRVEVDAGGSDFVKFLAPQYRLNDGAEYGIIGYGIDFIGESDGGGSEAPELMDSQYIPSLG